MASITELDPDGPNPGRQLKVREAWQVMAYIRQARVRKGLTQREFAARVGIPQQSTLAGYENTGKGLTGGHHHMPMIDKVIRMLDALGYDMVLRPRVAMRGAEHVEPAVGPDIAPWRPHALPEDQPIPGTDPTERTPS